MSKELSKYEPLLEITTFSGKKYYTLAKNKDSLLNDISNNKFIPIGGSIVNVSSIDTIDLASQEFSKLESMIADIKDEWIKNEIRKTVTLKTKEYNEQGKRMTDTVIQNIINSINK